MKNFKKCTQHCFSKWPGHTLADFEIIPAVSEVKRKSAVSVGVCLQTLSNKGQSALFWGFLGCYGRQRQCFLYPNKNTLDTTKFTFGVKSIMINDDSFFLIKCTIKRSIRSYAFLEIVMVDEYSSPKRAYIIWIKFKACLESLLRKKTENQKDKVI